MVVPNWTMDGKNMMSHDDFASDVIGYVYKIAYSNGQCYVGSKLIRSLTKLKPTKEQLTIRKNYVRKEMRDKPFIKYVGSSENTKNLTIVSREILEVCSTKRALTYTETKYLFSLKVLEDARYLNENILGKFYRNVLE